MLSPRQIIADLPPGWEFKFKMDLDSAERIRAAGQPATIETFFVGEDYARDHWLTIKVGRLDPAARAVFNPKSEQGTNTQVSGMSGVRRVFPDGESMLTYGPLGDFSLRIVSNGVDDKTIDELAATIGLVDGQPVLTGAEVLAPLRYRATIKGRGDDHEVPAAEAFVGAEVAIGYVFDNDDASFPFSIRHKSKARTLLR